MKDSIRPVPQTHGIGQALRRRPLASSVALALVGAAGIATAAHEGLPFTESFDDAHLSDAAQTKADWGAASLGELKLTSAEPLNMPFDPSAAGEPLAATITRAVAVGDLNGDGWPDLVVGAAGRGGIHLNDGSGNLGPWHDLRTETSNTRGVAIGDVNRDGHLDIVTASLNHPPRLYLNTGNGLDYVEFNFSATNAGQADAVVLADIDGDGWLDVVVATHAGRSSAIYFHSGNPAAPFDGVEVTPIGVPTLATQTVLVGDLDNDGQLDIVLINEDQPNYFYLNHGNRVFPNAGKPIGAESDDSQGAALGDVNGDGWLDLVVGNYTPGISRIYLNSGNPAEPFSGTTLPTNLNPLGEPDHTHHVLLVDVDLDGDLDILLSGAGLAGTPRWPNHLYLNDGTGNFDSGQAIGADTDITNAMVVGDFDLDGRPDVVAGNEDRDPITNGALPQANRLYRNIGMPAGLAPAAQLSGHATSLRVDDATTPIVSVALDATFAARTAHDAAAFWVSANGGAHWLSVQPGAGPVVVPPDSRGTDLRWRVFFNSLSPSSAAALALDSITLTAETEAPAGSPPAFTSAPVTGATVGTEYAYPIAATDPDGDALAITVASAPAWLTLIDNGDGTAALAGTPAEGDIGDHAVELVATDATTATATQSFTIAVVAANNPPTFTSTPLTSATAGSAYSYTIATADADDGDTRTITAATLPAWLTLVDNGDGTAALAGTPAEGDIGDHVVELVATDAANATATQPFTIAVVAAAANNPPTFTSTPPTSATAGSAYQYAIATADPDEGDTRTITAPTLPAWLTLTASGSGTATLSGTPTAANVGAHQVVLHVQDAAGEIAEQPFTITVAAAPATNPPPPPPRSSGGGGAAGLLELLGLAGAAMFLRRRRRDPLA